MVRRMPLAARRWLGIAVTAVVLIGGISAGFLAVKGSQGTITSQRNVVPHLVPDVGGLHAGSQGPSAAPKTTAEPRIELIPSAGAPVRAYGGAPSGAIFVPAQRN